MVDESITRPREKEQWVQSPKEKYQSLIQGIVTRVEVSLLFFEVNDDIRIYADLTKQHGLTFPSEGDTIEIRDLVIFAECEYPFKTGVMGPETIYNFPTSKTENTTKQLYWTLRKNNMLTDPEELLRINKLILQFSEYFCYPLIHKLLCKVVDSDPVKKKKSFKEIELKFTEDLNYVNDCYSEYYDILTFDSLCTFNVYPSRSSKMPDSMDQLLFGILDVDSTTGNFSLWNERTKEKSLVKFTPYSGDLNKFNNGVVMIQKWTVFTEIFKLENASTLKYILVDCDDVVIVERIQNKPKFFYGKNDNCPIYTPEYELFLIEKLSEAIFGYNNQPECWMEGLLLNVFNDRPQRVFLCYPNVQILPFLKENVVYKMFKPRRIISDKNCQLFGLRTKNPTFYIDKNTVFQETTTDSCLKTEKLLNGMFEVKEYMKSGISQHEYFSCIIKISRKQLQQYGANFKPHHPRRFRRPLPYFGNPDDDHQMRLICYDKEKDEYLDLYVNQRDSSVTPLGLIEDMLVKITHVQQLKQRYLKATVFTTYHILDYRPKVQFYSVPLRLVDLAQLNLSAIPSTPLGIFYSLPRTCIVTGPFMFHAIFDLSIVPICDKCKERVRAGSECLSCHVSKRDLRVKMVVNGQDARNPTFTVETGKHFFFKLLGLKDSQECESFANAFFKCDGFTIDFTNKSHFEADTVTKDANSIVMLTELVETIYSHINNTRLICLYNTVCTKKLDYPTWKMLYFETVYNSEFGE